MVQKSLNEKKQFTKKFHNFGDGNVSYIEWNDDKNYQVFNSLMLLVSILLLIENY